MPIEDHRRLAGLAWSSRAALGAFAALEVAAVVLFTTMGSRRLWFFGDEWAFFTYRRQLWAAGDHAAFLFESHNEHWVTVPVLWFSTVFKLVGLRHYWPYLLGVVLVHAGAAALLRALLRRAGAGPWLATGMAGVFALLGSGAENLTWAFQLSFVGAVALGLLQLWCAARGPERPGRADVLGVLAGVGSLMCSGLGITYVAVTTISLALRGRWRRAGLAAGGPGLAFGLWWLVYGKGTDSGLPERANEDIASFAWAGLVHVVDSVLGLPGAGAVVLLAALVAVSRAVGARTEGWYLSAAAAAGLAFFYLFTAIGRAGLGLPGALASRYVHGAAPLVLLALAPGAVWLADELRPWGTARLALGAVVAWSLLWNVSALWGFLRAHEPQVDASRQRIEAAAVLDLSGAPPTAQPDPVHAPNLTVASLEELLRDGDLPPPQGVDAAAIADATARLLVEVGGEEPPTAPVTVSGARPVEGGCFAIEAPGAQVSATPGSGFELQAEPPAKALVAVDVDGAVSPPLEVALSGPDPVPVRVGTQASLHVSAPAPGVELCPVPG